VKLGGGLANTIALTLTEHLVTNGQRRTAPPLKGTADRWIENPKGYGSMP